MELPKILRLFIAVSLSILVTTEETCFPISFKSSIVCSCNETHCGNIGVIQPEEDRVAVFQSTKSGLRFERSVLDFSNDTSQIRFDLDVKLNSSYGQKIIGFGGAFTDSAGINWANLKSRALRYHAIEAYYSEEGLDYNVGRIPMAGCDFSTRDYTYVDTPDDFEMKTFALAREDLDYKIPMIAKANDMSHKEILYFGSPWSAPSWMKTRDKTTGYGWLKGSPGGEYYKAWAKYFVKFLQAYKSNGINIWGFTLQNEPSTGFLPWKWQTMAMSPYMQRDFIKLDLGPALFNETDGKIQLMILDDSRVFLPWWANIVLKDEEAAKYTAGIGVHWYMDHLRSSAALENTHKAFPEKFIMYTESCSGYGPLDTSVILGSWERAEDYSNNILDDLRHFVAGWIDWNLLLDTEGGPNWVKNFVDATIIVDEKNQTFYKQPTYYAMGHFSKFITRDSVRILDEQKIRGSYLTSVSFLRPDKRRTTVILNQNNAKKTVRIVDTDGRNITLTVEARSITSLLWK